MSLFSASVPHNSSNSDLRGPDGDRVNKYGHFSAAGWHLKRGLHRGSSSFFCCGWKKSIGQCEVMAFCRGFHGYAAREEVDRALLKHHQQTVNTDPPLLVLLSIHHDHLTLGEGQLVRVVGHTVVDGFHSLRFLFLEKQETVTPNFRYRRNPEPLAQCTYIRFRQLMLFCHPGLKMAQLDSFRAKAIETCRKLRV